MLKDRLWGSMSERREGVWLVDEVDMASGHHGIWTPLCGLLLKVCDAKFHKVSFNSVLFNLMFKIVQRL